MNSTLCLLCDFQWLILVTMCVLMHVCVHVCMFFPMFMSFVLPVCAWCRFSLYVCVCVCVCVRAFGEDSESAHVCVCVCKCVCVCAHYEDFHQNTCWQPSDKQHQWHHQQTQEILQHTEWADKQLHMQHTGFSHKTNQKSMKTKNSDTHTTKCMTQEIVRQRTIWHKDYNLL